MNEFQQARIHFQEKILNFGLWQSCLNCAYWRPNIPLAKAGTIEDCTKFNAVPPLRVIILSCEAWLPRVPF